MLSKYFDREEWVKWYRRFEDTDHALVRQTVVFTIISLIVIITIGIKYEMRLIETICMFAVVVMMAGVLLLSHFYRRVDLNDPKNDP